MKSENNKLLAESFEKLNLASCDLIYENLESLNEVKSIIIIGSSWSGKTTIRNILADLAGPEFSFPKRAVTREQRPNDDLNENEFAVDLDDLMERVGGGIVWSRDLGETHEYYGFKKPKEGTVPVYSANNLLVRDKEKLRLKDRDIVDNSLILLVYAPDGEREERNKKREGDYLNDKPKQKSIRLSDKSDSMYPYAHIVINNSNTQDLSIQRGELEKILGCIGISKIKDVEAGEK